MFSLFFYVLKICEQCTPPSNFANQSCEHHPLDTEKRKFKTRCELRFARNNLLMLNRWKCTILVQIHSCIECTLQRETHLHCVAANRRQNGGREFSTNSFCCSQRELGIILSESVLFSNRTEKMLTSLIAQRDHNYVINT